MLGHRQLLPSQATRESRELTSSIDKSYSRRGDRVSRRTPFRGFQSVRDFIRREAEGEGKQRGLRWILTSRAQFLSGPGRLRVWLPARAVRRRYDISKITIPIRTSVDVRAHSYSSTGRHTYVPQGAACVNLEDLKGLGTPSSSSVLQPLRFLARVLL